jgi:peptidoglycan hydrolase-like protein with peptidoglycan-binding domain
VGAKPHTLERLLSISGKPLYAFVSATPLYKTLSTSLPSGSQKANVKVLQEALKQAGYYSGAANGDFGSATRTAFEDWQGAHGLTKTGKVTRSRFVWMPSGATIESWSVSRGSTVSRTTALATVDFPRELSVEAQVDESDLSSLKVGQRASCTIDGQIGDAFAATISSISTEATSSSSSSSSSSTSQYAVDFAPRGLPVLAKSGMTGSLTVTVDKRTNVLVVPSSAITTSLSGSFVQVMMNGKPVYRQVTIGLETSSLVQITAGLAAGEVVVTGTYGNSSSSTSSGFGGFSGGGFPRPTSGGFSGGTP